MKEGNYKMGSDMEKKYSNGTTALFVGVIVDNCHDRSALFGECD